MIINGLGFCISFQVSTIYMYYCVRVYYMWFCTTYIFARTNLKPRSHCPGIRPGASRQFAAGGPGRTRTIRKGIRVRSYIPGSATDQTRFGATNDHGLSR